MTQRRCTTKIDTVCIWDAVFFDYAVTSKIRANSSQRKFAANRFCLQNTAVRITTEYIPGTSNPLHIPAVNELFNAVYVPWHTEKHGTVLNVFI